MEASTSPLEAVFEIQSESFPSRPNLQLVEPGVYKPVEIAATNPEGPKRRGGTELSDINLYIQRAKMYPSMSKEDEYKFSEHIRRGKEAQKLLAEAEEMPDDERQWLEGLVTTGKEHTDEFVLRNLRLVVKQALLHERTGVRVPLMVLISYGNDGLREAVEKFDGRKGFKFSTYAHYWIKKTILLSIPAESYAIPRKSGLNESIQQIERWRDRINPETGLPYSDAEICELLGLEAKQFEELELLAARQAVSLEQRIKGKDDDEAELEHLVPDPRSEQAYEGTEEDDMRQRFHKALGKILTCEQLTIVALKSGFAGAGELATGRIGEMLGQKERTVLEAFQLAQWQMQHPSAYRHLKPFLPVQDGPAWQESAHCAYYDTKEIFADARGRIGLNINTDPAKIALMSVCETCPVKDECAALGDRLKVTRGLWGGTIAARRRGKRKVLSSQHSSSN